MQTPAAHDNTPDHTHEGQATARAGRVGEQHQQRSEEIGAGQIANEKWLTARQSATMRERQRLYLQHMRHCSSRRKPTVGGDVLRHFVTGDVIEEHQRHIVYVSGRDFATYASLCPVVS